MPSALTIRTNLIPHGKYSIRYTPAAAAATLQKHPRSKTMPADSGSPQRTAHLRKSRIGRILGMVLVIAALALAYTLLPRQQLHYPC